jgi:AcrR family transcriptional regulator
LSSSDATIEGAEPPSRPDGTAPASPETGADARGRLTRDELLRAAIALADEGGIESLSIRKLADAVDRRPMSLYHYVSGKDDILGGILELVTREFEPPAAEGEWRDAIRASAITAHEALLRHPWACPMLMSASQVSQSRLGYMEGLLGRLRLAGFSASMTHLAYHALDSHVIGHTLWEVGYSVGLRGAAPINSAQITQLLAPYPWLAEHAHEHTRPKGPSEPDSFEFGLDLILDGLELRLAAGGDVS